MKHSEILQLALDKYLAQNNAEASKKTRYICFALNRAVDELPHQAAVNKEEIADHILKCLHPSVTVTNWLILNNCVDRYPSDFQLDQIQLYRIRWTRHLIEEYKKQGK